MKTLSKIMMAMFAIATLGMAVACQKSDSTDDGTGDINASIVGTWKVVGAYDGEYTIPGMDNMNLSIVMNENGTGAAQSAMISYPFNWALNGTTLNITIAGDSSQTQTLTYTVTKLTATQCVIKGTVVPVIGYTAQHGEVRLDLERDGGTDPDPDPEPRPDPDPDPDPQPVDSAAFPAGTNWVMNFSQDVTIDTMGTEINATITLEGTLNFNATGNSGVMTYEGEVNATIPGVPIPVTVFEVDPTTVNFTYTFDTVTNTGTMTGAVAGAEPETIIFSYDAQNNRLVFPISYLIDEEELPEIPAGVEIPTEIYFVPAN